MFRKKKKKKKFTCLKGLLALQDLQFSLGEDDTFPCLIAKSSEGKGGGKGERGKKERYLAWIHQRLQQPTNKSENSALNLWVAKFGVFFSFFLCVFLGLSFEKRKGCRRGGCYVLPPCSSGRFVLVFFVKFVGVE